MRTIANLLLLGLFPILIQAQNTEVENDSTIRNTYPQILTDMTNAIIHQDSAITQLMEDKISGIVRGETEMQGFRVQIFSSNNQSTAKQEALGLENKLEGQLSQPIYVLYAPPFWKVRLGDFKTQEAANNFKLEFIEQYPELQGETYVVRDLIKVIK